LQQTRGKVAAKVLQSWSECAATDII
jgi:hypothetical protein